MASKNAKSTSAKKKKLVIIESPHKIKTLKKILGPSYKIEASVGHVRDMPKSELGVDVENNFEPKYITIRGKGDILAKLRKEVKDSSHVYLATDPDREGEAISWHLTHALKLDEKNTSRITFNAITKSSVLNGIKEARPIDMALVDAQQARRVLDRIIGYKISPLLWRKVKKGLSAGRVQSVALRIICDREAEIENFVPEEYWTIDAELAQKNVNFSARYPRENKISNEADANKIINEAKVNDFIVAEVKKGTRTKKPLPPFTTSTLQQEASKQFNFTSSKTMIIAQQLYEGIEIKGEGAIGLVSYIRTDSARISDEAFEEGKAYVTDNYGSSYAVSEKPEHKSRSRAQDAHEAIRPSYTRFRPDLIKESLSKDQFKLYNLIWMRFMASIMTPAVYDTVSVKIKSGELIFRASGSVMKFDGYKKLELKEEDDKAEPPIPELKEGEKLTLKQIIGERHFTQPPPRYSEGMLIKTLEEIGVGRPSTYAPTIATITTRNYVSKENKMFFPTELGEIVNEIMTENFDDIVDVDFTAKMEQDLDKVEDGEVAWRDVIGRFYPPFDTKLKEAEENLGTFEIKDEESDVDCELCGRKMVIKLGKFGKFLACPGFPECRNAKPYFEEAGVSCPSCNGKVMIKKTKKGRKYYGCENNPGCDFMSWNKPAEGKCPNCGSYLIEKGSRDRKICCTNNECGYFTEISGDEE